MKTKRILIDLNHAFDVHFFKNLYKNLVDKGFKVSVVISKKPHSYELISELGIPCYKIGSYGDTLLSKMFKLIYLDLKMLLHVLKFKPDLMLGHVSFRVSHIGWLLKISNIVFTDTEHASEQIVLFKPFSDLIVTPECFKKNLGPKQKTIKTIFELSYLHPNVFNPDSFILSKLKLKKEKPYFILRFISWNATHDLGQKGLKLTEKIKLTNYLSQKGKVFISAENEIEPEFEKYRIPFKTSEIHHAMAYSSLYIGEGATMASEAAVLGIPSIYVNDLKLGYITELEDNYKLLKTASSLKEIITYCDTILNDSSIKKKFQERHNRLLKEMIDPNEYMMSLVN